MASHCSATHLRSVVTLVAAMALLGMAGCGGGDRSSNPPPPPVTVNISPKTATAPVGTFQTFVGLALGATSTAVSWSASAGTIDSSGHYQAPASVPADGTATVTATSVSDPSASAFATVTITTNPVTISISPPDLTLKAGFSQLYTATVGGSTNNAVTWSVQDLPGDTSFPGFMTGGEYTAPSPVFFSSDKFAIYATSNADPSKTAIASVTVVPLENQQLQSFPIMLGTSGVNANSDCCTGTLGSLLADQNGTQYILSNNHILGRVGHASPGEAIVQPGYVDTECNFSLPDTVAHFTAAAALPGSNADAAIAEVVPGAVDPSGEIIGLGGIAVDGSYIPAPPASTTTEATVGMPVVKSGRTTGLSCANVLAVDGDFTVDLAPVCGNPIDQQIPFHNQVVMQGIGLHGDSGSLIVEAATSRPVALVAGITDDNQYTTANTISDVLNGLDEAAGLTLSFVGGDEHMVSCAPPAALKQESLTSDVQAPISRVDIAHASAAKNRLRASIMQDPAVLGLAIGRSAAHSNRAAIFIFLERGKTPAVALPASEDGFDVEVVLTSRFRADTAAQTMGGMCFPRTAGRTFLNVP